MVRKAETHA